MSAPLRLVVFDLDGTIVDSQANIVRAVAEVAKILGLPGPPAEHVPRVIGLSLAEALALLFPGVDTSTHKDLDREYREAFVRLRASPDYREPLFAGTHEILNALERAGFLLGIATGKAKRGVNHVLNLHGLTGRFVTVQTPEDAPGKPHPGMVLQAMAETGVEPRNTVMVGDTTFDIHMGLAAGVQTVGVSWGNHPVEDLKVAGAHRLIDRLSDLLHAAETLTAPVTSSMESAS
ncbi:MAG: HAD-IA family hydrolase [Rhodospirillaceae bacterium]|nr:HAD-IA family hydrolase [Rhodospirillaceae bacterium]